MIPYVKGLSENLAKVFKRYDIETIHKPSATLKNIICKKMKDQVHVLDKTGAVYYNKCKRYNMPKKNDYVGETDRVWRGRQYEHGVVDHKTANRSASINHPEDRPEPTRRPSTKSQSRNQPSKNYATMHKGTD